MSPWIVLEHRSSESDKRRGYVIYYRPKGETIDEFLYLLDFILQYQLLEKDTTVQIRTLNQSPNAPTLFGKAIDQCIDEQGAGSDFKKRLESIGFVVIEQVLKQFSDIAIGMEDA